MFKELKVIKLLVILGLLITLFISIKPEKLAGLYIITDHPSYYKGGTLTMYFKTGVPIHYSGNISIKNLITDKIVDEINVEFSNESVVESNIIENGFGKGCFSQIVLDESYSPGIYSIDGKTTFIVSNEEEVDITIVYPYLSSLLIEPYNDENALNSSVKFISKSRNVSLDKYTSNWIPYFQWLGENYNVNYITDLQLADISNFDKSKCLFIYGNSAFWTKEMKSSFLSYIQDGSSVLIASTYIMNNAIWDDENNNAIAFSDDGKRVGYKSWGAIDTSSLLEEIGMSYIMGPKINTSSKITITNSKHPLFEGVDVSSFEISLAEFVGYPISGRNTYNELFGFKKAELLAISEFRENDKATFGGVELQKDSLSGTIISLGTGEWAEQEMFKNKGDLFKIAQNGASYLIKL
jgi:hypothetical protein